MSICWISLTQYLYFFSFYFRCSILSSCKLFVVYFVPQKSAFCTAVPLCTPTSFVKMIISCQFHDDDDDDDDDDG
jgi:hypothetical protein